MNKINRRNFIKIAGSAAAISAVGFPAIAAAGGKKKVVIVGKRVMDICGPASPSGPRLQW